MNLASELVFPWLYRLLQLSLGCECLGDFPETPPKEARRRFLTLLGVLRDVLPICVKLSSKEWNVSAKLHWVALPSSPRLP